MTMTAETAADRLQTKARELAARTAAFLHAREGDRAFAAAMVEESADAVAFWAEELKKAAAK